MKEGIRTARSDQTVSLPLSLSLISSPPAPQRRGCNVVWPMCLANAKVRGMVLSRIRRSTGAMKHWLAIPPVACVVALHKLSPKCFALAIAPWVGAACGSGCRSSSRSTMPLVSDLPTRTYPLHPATGRKNFGPKGPNSLTCVYSVPRKSYRQRLSPVEGRLAQTGTPEVVKDPRRKR